MGKSHGHETQGDGKKKEEDGKLCINTHTSDQKGITPIQQVRKMRVRAACAWMVLSDNIHTSDQKGIAPISRVRKLRVGAAMRLDGALSWGREPFQERRASSPLWASYIKSSVHTPVLNKGFVFLTLPTFLKPTVAPHSSN